MKAAAIGTFDGVHEGHRLLLRTLREQAARHGLDPIVVTFDRHPLEVVAPQRAPLRLSTSDEQLRLLAEERVEVTVVPFTQQTRILTAEQWLRRLRDTMGVRLVVLGYDNTFGSDGRHLSASDYDAIGEALGLLVAHAPRLDGVSSSAVRRAVAAGDVELAAKMLGRPYALEGAVEHGRHLGTGLGFPTANVAVSDRMAVPADGVYACYVALPGGVRRKAVVNVGTRPTVEAHGERSVEAHILSWSGDLYGCRVRVEFIRRLRSEMKFGSLRQLREAIARDAAQASLLP